MSRRLSASGVRRGLCSLLLPVLILPLMATRGAGAPPPRLELPGTIEPGRADSDRLGDASPGMVRTVAVSLPLRNPEGLHQLISAVSTPGSPQYGQYLTAEQFADRFGPTPDQVAAVSNHLRGQGLTVPPVSPGSTIVDASGTLAALGGAFGTTFGRFHDRRLGRDYVANDGPATLPADVAPLVQGVSGLDDHHPQRSHAATPRAGSGPGGGYTPAQLKAAYDVTPLATAGFTGGDQSIGLFELDGFSQSNVSHYDSQFGLSPPAPSVHPVDGGSGALGAGQIEVELDIEILQAIAPAASITVYEGPNTDQGTIDTYNAMLTGAAPTNSTSWGLCEAQSNQSTVTALDNIFATAASRGLSFFAASGDAGAYDCGDTNLAVDNPADDPYVTGVGGTSLTVGSSSAYSSESVWSNPNDTTFGPKGSGSGGGLSTKFSHPSWQSGPGVSNSFSNGNRQVPDVASDADPNTGISVYATSRDPKGILPPQTGWFVVGGTSAGAPSWAAFTALYNQEAGQAGVPRVGFVSPTLYALASTSEPFTPFHDVTSGNNLFYPATAGWDYATGLGSYDGNNLARDLINTGLSAGATADASPVQAGSSIGFTLTVANSSAAGTATALGATLSAPLPAGPGVSWTISPAYGGPGSCTIAGSTGSQSLSCGLGNMAAGASASVHLSSGTTNASCTGYTVTGTVSATNAAPHVASATTTVQCPGPDLAITASHTGFLTTGEPGSLVLTVANRGTDVTTGTTTVTDTLPAGLSLVSASGSGWTCGSSAPVSCTMSATLAAGATSSITVGVNVTAPGGTTVTNTATVSPTDSSPSDNTSAESIAVLTHTQRYVEQAYLDLLGRQADAGGLSFWSTAIDNGTARDQISVSFTTATEYRETAVNNLYLHYLHHPATAATLQSYANAINNGQTYEQVIAALTGSDEYFNLTGTDSNGAGAGAPGTVEPGGDITNFVKAVYVDVLNRPADSGGLTFWVNEISSGRQQRSAVATAFSVSQEYYTLLVTADYHALLRRDPDPGGLTFWVSSFQNGTRDERMVSNFVGSLEYYDWAQAH